MKVEWLNDEMTEARVTRGALWWKRVAVMRRATDMEWAQDVPLSRWRFVPSNRATEWGMGYALEERRKRVIAKRPENIDWHRPSDLALPKATARAKP